MQRTLGEGYLSSSVQELGGLQLPPQGTHRTLSCLAPVDEEHLPGRERGALLRAEPRKARHHRRVGAQGREAPLEQHRHFEAARCARAVLARHGRGAVRVIKEREML